jgi:hypothetical protein
MELVVTSSDLGRRLSLRNCDAELRLSCCPSDVSYVNSKHFLSPDPRALLALLLAGCSHPRFPSHEAWGESISTSYVRCMTKNLSSPHQSFVAGLYPWRSHSFIHHSWTFRGVELGDRATF